MNKLFYLVATTSVLLLTIVLSMLTANVAHAADLLTVSANTIYVDNLIGATNTQWTFTATTTTAIGAGNIVQFILPTFNQGPSFSATSTSIIIIATSSIDLYVSTSSNAARGLLVAQTSGGPVIYGFATSTILAGSTTVITIGGINNASGQISSLSNLSWTMMAGTSTNPNNPGGSLLSQPTFSTTTIKGITRAGNGLVSDSNSSVANSSYDTSVAATTTFSITLATALPAGSKIGINFPPEYNLQNATTTYAYNISTSSAAQILPGAISTSTNMGVNRVILTTSGGTVLAGNTITVTVAGLTNPANPGVYRPFSVFTMKSNSGLLDGSYFGFEQSDFSGGTPPPTDTLHIGGKNTLAIQVLKSTGGAGTTTLTASDLAQVKVGVGCPDKQFFMGERWLNANGVAQFNNILDCNYMMGVNPFNKGSQTFYNSFLPPSFKNVNLVSSGGVGQSATTTLVFGVPDSTATIELAGGVLGQNAFINAFSADNQSFSNVFTDSTYTTPGFNASGYGFARVKINSGADWNFNVVGGSFGSGANFTDASGAKYWPPVIPSIRLASASTTDMGTSTYVLADKNLVVALTSVGGGSVANVCVGVMRTGGGIFTGPQDVVCSPNYSSTTPNDSYRFKVPAATTISVQIMKPGGGQPVVYPVSINAATTTKTIALSSPTSFITVSVQATANGTTSPVNGASVFAQGSNGFANSMTGTNGTVTLYVQPGTYTVQGFAPSLGPLTAQTGVTVGGSNPTATFIVNSGSLKKISGQVTQGGSGVAGINIGVHGTGSSSGGSGAQTDSSGNYSLYVPAGTYQVEGWSQSTGGLAQQNVDVTSANATNVNWAIGAQGTLQIEIQNASNAGQLFAGAFSPSTGRGNGTNSWVASTTAPLNKVAIINLPAGTYEVHAGSPSTGELGMQPGVVIAVGQTKYVFFNASSSASLVTLRGNVSSGGSNISGVNIWVSRINGPGFFSTQTDTSGNYLLSVPDQTTYRVGVKSMLYVSDQGDVNVTLAGSTTKNFTVSSAGSTISGTLLNSSAVGISNAWVNAFRQGGAASSTQIGSPTDASGNFTLNVPSSSTWNLVGQGPCYLGSSPVSAIAGDSGKNITLTAQSGCSAPVPQVQSITDTSGGQISKNDVVLNIPGNALGTLQSSVNVSVSNTANVVASANATPLRSAVKTITASNSAGSSITSLNSSVSLTISYDQTQLPNNFDESKIQLGYFDSTTGNWEPVAATVSTSTHTITAQVNHFTDYGPILPGVPDAPTSLTATVASASQINLSWTASPTATTYTIYRSSTDSNYTTALTTLVTGTTYNDTSPSASTQYFYKVAGVNSSGEGFNSSSANATTNAAAVVASSGGSSSSGGSMVSPAELARLLATSTVIVNAVKPLTSTTTVVIVSPYYRIIDLGKEGDDVTALQTFLESKKFLVMPNGVAKGYFGAKTKNALKLYQKSKRISATGNLGPLTRQAIEADTAKTIVPVQAIVGTTTTSTSFTRTLKIGDDGDDVTTLQTFLENKGYLTILVGMSKGHFGPLTKKAVIVFQKEMGIDQIGIVGPATRAAIISVGR